MAVAVIMPRQGNTVESCIITKWAKKPGDAVKMGDILFSYETDKAAFDEEAKVEGTLLAVFFQEVNEMILRQFNEGGGEQPEIHGNQGVLRQGMPLFLFIGILDLPVVSLDSGPLCNFL